MIEQWGLQAGAWSMLGSTIAPGGRGVEPRKLCWLCKGACALCLALVVQMVLGSHLSGGQSFSSPAMALATFHSKHHCLCVL